MIVLSSKVRYAVAATLELVNSYGRGLLQTKVIAERRRIPPNYLEQLLHQLTKAGLVRAVRGSRGGYELALDPANITVLQVWEIMEGGPDVTQNGGQAVDALQDLYREAEQELKRVFSIPLSELLVRQQRHDENVNEGLMFHI